MNQQAHPSRSFEKCTFQVSAARYAQCPADEGREVAFAGRSNAGKSSAINALTRNRKMAKTSKTPGRTQLFNFFELGDGKRLVDLPGYGFAKVPEAVKRQWHQQIDRYLRERQSLAGLILVTDIRHPLNEFDRTLLAWASTCELPLHILLTKADKLKAAAVRQQLQRVDEKLQEYHNPITLQAFSAMKRNGVDELAETLQQWLNM
jgi:GTP-binding protein